MRIQTLVNYAQTAYPDNTANQWMTVDNALDHTTNTLMFVMLLWSDSKHSSTLYITGRLCITFSEQNSSILYNTEYLRMSGD